MLRQNIVGGQPVDQIGQEFGVMARKEGPQGTEGLRSTGLSLFRPGQTVAYRPVTLDQKTGREIFLSPASPVPLNPARVWESLGQITPDPIFLAGNGLFPEGAKSGAAATFDILRTRILQALAAKKWGRIAITSPTHGCGKSFVAANLALSLARMPSCRTVLLDLELRQPHLAGLFGVKEPGAIADFLRGEQPLESIFCRIGRNLALGLNGEAVETAAELLFDPETGQALSAMRDMLQPDVVLCDMPPALGSDDLLALADHVDAVLLVTDGTRTSPDDIRRTERLLEGRLPLLGVVLNRAQDRAIDRYRYGRR